jgi:hypothetical protein
MTCICPPAGRDRFSQLIYAHISPCDIGQTSLFT